MGLIVTDVHGRRISTAPATARHAARGLNLLTLGFGYMLVVFNTDKRGLHDLVAGTRVVRTGKRN